LVLAAQAAAAALATNVTALVVEVGASEFEELAGEKETIDVFLDIGRSLVPDNVAGALVDTNILGIIVFFLCFGFAVNHQNSDESRRVLSFFSVCNDAMMYLVTGVIVLTPLGVSSLVASEVSKQEQLWSLIEEMGMLILATAIGILFQILVVYPSYYAFFTKKNPYKYLKNVVPAITTAFACSSSAATLPVTLRCAEEGNLVSTEITRFVLPLGATVNMDGTAIYYPIAVIFCANIQGIFLSFGEQVTVAIVSAFVSIGAAPIPSAGLVYLILIMSAVSVPITDAISFVMAVDWLLDRFQTCCNITGDSFGAGVLDQKRMENEERMLQKKATRV
jgi:Na+/H+-dicarboxylate symporter